MRRTVLIATYTLSSLSLSLSYASAPDEPADLAITRVGVFSSGVAYFERSGEVEGDSQVELTFHVDQINDLIKSLVVQDLGGGAAGVVSYGSRDPVERTLRSFAVDLTENPSFNELLDQLRGEPISIEAPRRVTGVIVGVDEQIQSTESETRIVEHFLVVLTDDGLETLPLRVLRGVELQNPRIAEELRQALATLAAGRDSEKKTVSIRFEGEGRRRVRVMYLLESPIWKTSYRLVIPAEGEPLLQGWATVDNTTSSDWRDITLSLYSGRPISFRMDLYTPLYVPRPLEELELYASLRPPAFDEAFLRREVAAPAAPMPAALRAEFESARTQRSPGRAGAFAAGDLKSVATAVDAGELFEYTIDRPVSIERQRSAMLPIVAAPVKLSKLSVYNRSNHPKHPLHSLQLINSTGLSLMQGPMTVFEGGAYAGDVKLPNLQPDEERLVSYALDLPVSVNVENGSQTDELRFRIANGVLFRQLQAVMTAEYTIRNQADAARTLMIEHPRQGGWELVSPSEPDETTENYWRFKRDVASQAAVTMKIATKRVFEESAGLLDLDADTTSLYLQSRVISDAVKQALTTLRTMKSELAQLQRELVRAEQTVSEAIEDQERVRRNLAALRDGTDSYGRQLARFEQLEQVITETRREIDTLRDRVEAQRRAIEAFIASLRI